LIRWSVKEFDEVDSTQIVAGKLGADGAPEGTVVVAKTQTAGRGRHGRSWTSPEGGLYMSLLLRPPPSAEVQAFTLVAALAVARGIESDTGLDVLIRWPNDIVIEGKKAAGVITESSYHGRTLSFVSVGIGVNCNSRVPSTETQGNRVTSLTEELGRHLEITRLRQSILKAFGELYASWLRGANATEIASSRIGTLGKRVLVRMRSGESLEGVAEDIEPSGGLLVNSEGRKLTLRAEDVEWLRET
jgi:BirA family biotin operon repressor/biotin-[acetyl-CoA-carboxylase] ligase